MDLRARIKAVLVRAYHASPATLPPHLSQPFRDAARQDTRPLGVTSVDRCIVALAGADPDAGRALCEALAAELLVYADAICPSEAPSVTTALMHAHREDSEADRAVVGVIGQAEGASLDGALVEQSEKIAAALRTMRALVARRSEIVRPMSHGWRA